MTGNDTTSNFDQEVSNYQIFRQEDSIDDGIEVVWHEKNIDAINKDPILRILRRQFYQEVELFDDAKQCAIHIQNGNTKTIFLITLFEGGENMIPDIHDLKQLRFIYIYGATKDKETLIQTYPKIQAIVQSKWVLLKQLLSDIRLLSEDNKKTQVPPFQACGKELITGSWESLGFKDAGIMWFQFFIDVLCKTPPYGNWKQNFINKCKKYYEGSNNDLKYLNEFERDYNTEKAIWWYTRDTFIYRLFNRTLREQSIGGALVMHFFIYDLYQQLADKLKNSTRSSINKVFRGQWMSQDEINQLKNKTCQGRIDIDQLKRGQKGPVFVNQFYSASSNEQVAKMYVGDTEEGCIFADDSDLKRVLVTIEITDVIEKPFADIHELSDISDDEVLFSIGSSFKVTEFTYNDELQRWSLGLRTEYVSVDDDWCEDDEYDLTTSRNCRDDEKSRSNAFLLQAGYWMQLAGMNHQRIIQYYKLVRQYLTHIFTSEAYYCGLALIQIQEKNYDIAMQYLEQSEIDRCRNQLDNRTDEHPERDHYQECLRFAIYNCIASINFMKNGYENLLQCYSLVISMGFGCFFSWTLNDMLQRFLEYAHKCKINEKFSLICDINKVLNDAQNADVSFELALESWLNRNRHYSDDDHYTFLVVLLHVDTSEEAKFDEIMVQNEKLIEYIASDGKNANELFKLYHRMGDMYSNKNRTNRALLWFGKALEWVPGETMALYLEHVVDTYLKNPESFSTIQSFSNFFDCFLNASSLPLDLISPICEQITTIRTETNNLDAAIHWYQKLSNVCRKTPRDIRLLPLYECLADTYKLKGLYSLAKLTYQDIFFMASQADVYGAVEIKDRCRQMIEIIEENESIMRTLPIEDIQNDLLE